MMMVRRSLAVQCVVSIAYATAECRKTRAEGSFNLPKTISENIIQTTPNEINTNFIVAFDTRTKCPKFVIEKLTRETFVNKGTEDKKRPPFHAESTITNNSFKVYLI
jgi:hypothetical protein